MEVDPEYDRCDVTTAPVPPNACPLRYTFLGFSYATTLRIRRFHALGVQKHPQRLTFALQTSGKYPSFVLVSRVLTQ